MQIIPVIDIRKGEVVRAVAGDRANYRTLTSPLTRSPAPSDVVAGLLAHYRFQSLYIADLDAIEGRGANDALLATLTEAHPQLRFWVDAGLREPADAAGLLARGNVDVVFGSESFTSPDALAELRGDPRFILSLDFRGDVFLGDPQILAQAAFWPSRIIVMTLARVGLGQGPDYGSLSEILARANGREVYAAGGVRDNADLERLDAMGVAGALVASALHDGALAQK